MSLTKNLERKKKETKAKTGFGHVSRSSSLAKAIIQGTVKG